MYHLERYINMQFDEKKYNIEEVKSLCAIVAYDGLECSEIIESDCLLKPREADYPFCLYYGNHPNIIGEEIDKNETLTGDFEFYCPVAIIMDMDGIVIKEAYPFDPSALGADVKISKELYKFCLGNDALTIRKYVRVFFGSNENYIRKRGVKVIEEGSVTAHRLSQILKTNTANQKKYTVSLLIGEEIHLLNCIKCIILPEKLLAYDCFSKLKTKSDIVIKAYETEMNVHPMLYNFVVSQKISEFYSENGLL